jgi:hypothetical protein
VRVRMRDWRRFSGAQDGGVQRMAVFPLGELRPRLGRCAGKSHTMREELQCGGCGRIRTGAAGPRVEDVGGRREEGSGRGQAALRAARGERRWPGATSSEEPRCNQAQRAPITHTEVEVGATRHGFNAQRKAGGGGRPALTVSQQVERAAELQDPEVRAELDWRVRGCKRECSTGGRLGSIPQACAYARQQTTCRQVGGRWCGSKTGAAALRMAAQVCWPCTHLSSQVLCEQRCSVGHALASHVRGQRKLSPSAEGP